MKIADVVPSSLSASLRTALLFINRNAGLKQLILSLCFPLFPVFLHPFPTIYVSTMKLYLSFLLLTLTPTWQLLLSPPMPGLISVFTQKMVGLRVNPKEWAGIIQFICLEEFSWWSPKSHTCCATEELKM